jgi:hypothetical protein
MNQNLHRLLGLAALLFGLGYLGWLGYNLLIEEQQGFRLRSAGQILGPLLFAGVGGYWLYRHR